MSEREMDDFFISEIASELKRPVRIDSDLDARVMAAIETPVVPLRRPASRPWLLRTRTFAISPLGGFAVAATIAGILVLGVRGGESPAPLASAPAVAPPIEIQPVTNAVPALVPTPFVLADPNARSVAVVGDFNDWEATATPLTRSGTDGVWTASILLPPGRHEYQFVVDGKLRPDPAAPAANDNDFGDTNSVITVGRGLR